MRAIAAILVLIIWFGLPASGIADETIATFQDRWPEASMRQGTSVETARLVANAPKDSLKPAIDAELLARIGRPPSRCDTMFCGLLSSR
jgi:hypothetical protein